jgi:glycosyltransferase involved in cell wall biosynthesis
MPLPHISIVTPSFNQAEYLEETIQSVLDQDYPNLEYIVIDGRSTDGSVEIIKRYAPSLHYWVSEPDRGQADAIMKGFQHATGEVLGWLNSDDVYLPGALSKVAGTFQRYPGIGFVIGDYIRIGADSQIFRCLRLPKLRKWLYSPTMNWIPQPSVFFTRKAFVEVGGLDTELSYSIDADLWCRFIDHGIKARNIRAYLSAFRTHPNSKGSTKGGTTSAREQKIIMQRDYYNVKLPRHLHRILWLALQTANGNYLLSTLDTLATHGRAWQFAEGKIRMFGG